MAFVNVAATSVDASSDIDSTEDVESRKESEQRSHSPIEGNSAAVVSSSDVGEALQYKTYGQFKCDDKWWRKTVIYEVYVRSFFDSNNDGIGDLKGIEDKLDYFKRIGVNTLWLTPMYVSPMVDFGYDISSFTEIDPIFGTMDDFKKLLRSMKDKEMKIILDFVPNHTSGQHEWFKKSVLKEYPYSDYYIWKSPKKYDEEGQPVPPNNWTSIFRGSAWEYNTTRQQFYLHQFATEQPDLNFRNPLVIQEMVNVMNFWLELGVDGFRLDAAPHLLEDDQFRDNPPAKTVAKTLSYTEEDYCFWDNVFTCNCPGVLNILRTFREVCDQWSSSENERVLMTESYLPLPKLMEYYGTPTNPIGHFSFNFELLGLKNGCNAKAVFNCITSWLDALPEGYWPNWQTGNHDQPRIASKLGEESVDLMNIILLLLPGTAVTYYGEEIGMTNAKISWDQTVDPAGRNAGPERFHLFTRDPERSPMQWNSSGPTAGFSGSDNPWLPVNPDFPIVNVQVQTETEGSHLHLYKKLIALRESNAWQNGNLDVRVLSPSCGGSVLSFTRIDKASGEGLLVLANFSTMTGYVCIKDFDHVPIEENSVVVVAAAAFVDVTDFRDRYKEGAKVCVSDKIKLNGMSGLVCKFNMK